MFAAVWILPSEPGILCILFYENGLMVSIFITGLSGFIGQQLRTQSERAGYRVFTLPRKQLLEGGVLLVEALRNADVVVNLAGESIMGRWSVKKKNEILESRVQITRNLVNAIAGLERKPQLFINASAVGIYKPDSYCDEDTKKLGNDFLAKVVKAWEGEALKLREVRCVVLRFGVVFGKDGGVWRQILPMLKTRIYFILGTGAQAMPMIHVEDIAGFILYAVVHVQVTGIYNMVVPQQVSFREFIHALSMVRSSLLNWRVPCSVLKMVMGESAFSLLNMAHVKSIRLRDTGYDLKYRNVNEIIESLINEKNGETTG